MGGQSPPKAERTTSQRDHFRNVLVVVFQEVYLMEGKVGRVKLTRDKSKELHRAYYKSGTIPSTLHILTNLIIKIRKWVLLLLHISIILMRHREARQLA